MQAQKSAIISPKLPIDNAVWTVRFLGVPEAHCEGTAAHLRSKKTWALLACLLLPPSLSAQEPIALPRNVLADRFWGDSPTRRASLCMALNSLRQNFGAERFVESHHIAQTAPGWFVTDIDQVLALHAQAITCTIPQERLRLLADAAAQIRGEFLEGCFSRSDSEEEDAQSWYLGRRLEIHGRMAAVLLDFCKELEAAHNDNGAFEVALRILRLHPHHPEAREIAWKLARRTGQSEVVRTLDAGQSLTEALTRLEDQQQKGHVLTPKEQENFRSLVQEELAALAAQDREQFLRLTFFPAPFTPELAQIVCRVSPKLLATMVKTPMLMSMPRTGERGRLYMVPEAVRDCVRHRIPTAVHRQMEKRLGLFCERWLHDLVDQNPPFGTAQDAEPFLALALDWTVQQPPTESQINFLSHLRLRGLTALVERILPYLTQVCDSSTHPDELRVRAAIAAGELCLSRSEFAPAEDWFQKALAVLDDGKTVDETWGVLWAGLLWRMLTLATHYRGDSGTALTYLGRATQYFRSVRNELELGTCLRLQCEIQNRLEEYDQALASVDEALTIRRRIQVPQATVADTLFWKGSTLWRLRRTPEATAALTEALDLWQDVGDKTGIGHCLRLLGAIHAEQGQYAEARAHLEHAIALHQDTGDQGSRIAAVGVLGDIFFQQGRFSEARVRYAECLADSEARQRPQSAEAYRAKLAGCGPLGGDTDMQPPEAE